MKFDTDNWPRIEEKCRAILPERIVRHIEQCRKTPHHESHLIAVLHMVQGHFGFLGPEQMDAVAQLLQVPAAKVTGVATFYHYFRLRPRGRYIVNVCMGTACYVKGAADVAKRVQQELGVAVGETTSDNVFSLVESRCLGTCGLAPVMMIGDDVHGKVKPDDVPALIAKYRQLAAQQPAVQPQE
jgi:NADH:ubiquinone oxidoreductase subunit E